MLFLNWFIFFLRCIITVYIVDDQIGVCFITNSNSNEQKKSLFEQLFHCFVLTWQLVLCGRVQRVGRGEVKSRTCSKIKRMAKGWRQAHEKLEQVECGHYIIYKLSIFAVCPWDTWANHGPISSHKPMTVCMRLILARSRFAPVTSSLLQLTPSVLFGILSINELSDCVFACAHDIVNPPQPNLWHAHKFSSHNLVLALSLLNHECFRHSTSTDIHTKGEKCSCNCNWFGG